MTMDLKASQMAELIAMNLRADVVTYVTGEPGVGKTDLFKQVTAAEGYHLLPVHACVYDAVDIKGLPFVVDIAGTKYTEWTLPDIFPRLTDRPTLLFVDDLPAAQLSVQTALFGLFHGKRVGPHVFPANCRVAGAGNTAKQKAGAAKLLTPIKSRMMTVNLISDVADWVTWALGAGIETELIAFHQFRQAIGDSMLNRFDPEADSFASSRTWELADRVMKQRPAPYLELPAYTGLVGTGPATELVGFLRICRDLQSPAAILMSPSTADVPADKPNVMFAICSALAKIVSNVTADAFFEYANRMPDAFSVFMVTSAIRKDKALMNCRAGIAWQSKHADVFTS